ncbi:MAG: hypothetical protein CHACPFDD_01477 [Phycisphaerae bacterium]|nr:hypothetical protein [Phycisphaerae bacterium]
MSHSSESQKGNRPVDSGQPAGGIDDLLRLCQWHDADSTPFGVRLFDCRPFCESMISTSADPDVAARFVTGAAAPLSAHAKVPIGGAITATCDLGYPCHRLAEEGMIVRAEEMEYKWHAYQSDSELLFVRSWTGQLVARGTFRHEKNRWLVVDRVDVDATMCQADPALAAQQFDFLVKAMVYSSLACHPLPPSIPDDATQIAMYSFSVYGRHGGIASFADTLATPVLLPNQKWSAGNWPAARRAEFERDDV